MAKQIKICLDCRLEFEARDYRQKRCRKCSEVNKIINYEETLLASARIRPRKDRYSIEDISWAR